MSPFGSEFERLHQTVGGADEASFGEGYSGVWHSQLWTTMDPRSLHRSRNGIRGPSVQLQGHQSVRTLQVCDQVCQVSRWSPYGKFGNYSTRFLFRIDVDKNKMKIKIWLPRLEINSNYTMEGRILMMPIQGTGTTTGNYSELLKSH